MLISKFIIIMRIDNFEMTDQHFEKKSDLNLSIGGIPYRFDLGLTIDLVKMVGDCFVLCFELRKTLRIFLDFFFNNHRFLRFFKGNISFGRMNFFFNSRKFFILEVNWADFKFHFFFLINEKTWEQQSVYFETLLKHYYVQHRIFLSIFGNFL